VHSIALTRGIRDSLHAYYVCVLREKASRSKQEWKVEKVYLKEELKGEERKNLYYPLKTTSSNHLMLKTKNLEFMEEKYCIILRIAYHFLLKTLPSLSYIIQPSTLILFYNWNALPFLICLD